MAGTSTNIYLLLKNCNFYNEKYISPIKTSKCLHSYGLYQDTNNSGIINLTTEKFQNTNLRFERFYLIFHHQRYQRATRVESSTDSSLRSSDWGQRPCCTKPVSPGMGSVSWPCVPLLYGSYLHHFPCLLQKYHHTGAGSSTGACNGPDQTSLNANSVKLQITSFCTGFVAI